MKLDDETLLTAYLDDELDPPRRLVIEAALLSKPQLAERLQELAAVRSLVDGMARPTVTYDVSGALLDEISSGPSKWIRLRRLAGARMARPRVLAAAAVFMLAGTVCVALGIQLAERQAAPVKNSVVSHPQPSPRPQTSSDSSSVLAHHANSVSVPKAGADSISDPTSPAVPAVLSDADRKMARDHETIRRLLDRPGIRRMTVVLDTLDPAQLAKIESAIDRSRPYNSPRAKFRIGQGMAVDPARPNEAVVYLVVIPEGESEDFRRTLESQAPEGALAEDDKPASAELVTQLADIGQLELIRGKAAAELSPNPPIDDPKIAHKHDGDSEPVVIEPAPGNPVGPKNVRRSTADSTHPRSIEQRARDADEARQDRERRLAAAKLPAGEEQLAANSQVYLVWVTTPGPG